MPFNLPELTDKQIDSLQPQQISNTQKREGIQLEMEDSAGKLKPLVQLFNTLGSKGFGTGLVQGPWNAATDLTNAIGDKIQRKEIDTGDNYLKMSDETARWISPTESPIFGNFLQEEGYTQADVASKRVGEVVGAEYVGAVSGTSALKQIQRAAWVKTFLQGLHQTRRLNTGLKSAVQADKARRWAKRGEFTTRGMFYAGTASLFLDESLEKGGNLSNFTEDVINKYFETDLNLPLSVDETDDYITGRLKGTFTDMSIVPILRTIGIPLEGMYDLVGDSFAPVHKATATVVNEVANAPTPRYQNLLDKGIDGLPKGVPGGAIVKHDSAISRAIDENLLNKQVVEQRDWLKRNGLVEVGENGQLELTYPGAIDQNIKTQFDVIRRQRGELIRTATQTGEDVSKQLDELDKLEDGLTEQSLAGNPAQMPSRIIEEQLEIPDARVEMDTLLAQLNEISDLELRQIHSEVNAPAIRAQRTEAINQGAARLKEIETRIEQINQKIEDGSYTPRGGKRELNKAQKALTLANEELAVLQESGKKIQPLVGDQLELALKNALTPITETVEKPKLSWFNKPSAADIQAGEDGVNRIINSLDKALGTEWKGGPIDALRLTGDVIGVGRSIAEETVQKAIRDINRVNSQRKIADAKVERIEGKKITKAEVKTDDVPPTLDEYKNDLMQLGRDELRSISSPSENPEIAAIVKNRTGRRVWKAKKEDIVNAFVEYYQKTGFYGRPLYPGEEVQSTLPIRKANVETTSPLAKITDAEGVESLQPVGEYQPRGMSAVDRDRLKAEIIQSAVRNGEVQPPSSPLPKRPTTTFVQDDFINELLTDETGQLSMLYNSDLLPTYEAGGKNAMALIDEMRLRYEYQTLDAESLRVQKEAFYKQQGWDKLPFEEKKRLGILNKWEYALKGEEVIDGKLINVTPTLQGIKEQQQKFLDMFGEPKPKVEPTKAKKGKTPTKPKPPKKPPEKEVFTKEGIVPEKTKKEMDKVTEKKGTIGTKQEINLSEQSLNDLDAAIKRQEKIVAEANKKADGGICQ